MYYSLNTNIFLLLKIYLFERQSDAHTHTHRFSTYCFTPQQPDLDQPRPRARNSILASHAVAGTQALVIFHFLCRVISRKPDGKCISCNSDIACQHQHHKWPLRQLYRRGSLMNSMKASPALPFRDSLRQKMKNTDPLVPYITPKAHTPIFFIFYTTTLSLPCPPSTVLTKQRCIRGAEKLGENVHK